MRPARHRAVGHTPKPSANTGSHRGLYVPGFRGGVQGQLDHGREDSVRHVLPSGQQAGHAHPLQQVGQVLGGALPHRRAQVAADAHRLNMKDAHKETQTTEVHNGWR